MVPGITVFRQWHQFFFSMSRFIARWQTQKHFTFRDSGFLLFHHVFGYWRSHWTAKEKKNHKENCNQNATLTWRWPRRSAPFCAFSWPVPAEAGRKTPPRWRTSTSPDPADRNALQASTCPSAVAAVASASAASCSPIFRGARRSVKLGQSNHGWQTDQQKSWTDNRSPGGDLDLPEQILSQPLWSSSCCWEKNPSKLYM